MRKDKKNRKDRLELLALGCAGAAIVIWAGWSVGNKVKTTISSKTYGVGTGAIDNYLLDISDTVQTEFYTESAADESEANAAEEKRDKGNEKETKEEKEGKEAEKDEE